MRHKPTKQCKLFILFTFVFGSNVVRQNNARVADAQDFDSEGKLRNGCISKPN